jgi:hypothetical protein
MATKSGLQDCALERPLLLHVTRILIQLFVLRGARKEVVVVSGTDKNSEQTIFV